LGCIKFFTITSQHSRPPNNTAVLPWECMVIVFMLVTAFGDNKFNTDMNIFNDAICWHYLSQKIDFQEIPRYFKATEIKLRCFWSCFCPLFSKLSPQTPSIDSLDQLLFEFRFSMCNLIGH
jgi:hypothetical protein